MSEGNQLRKGQRRSVNIEYTDSEGKKQVRATSDDFETLPVRHIRTLRILPGFEQDEKLVEWMSYARSYYDIGEYARAHQYLTRALRKMPALEPYVFHYVRVCERILAIPLEEDEFQYEAKLARYRALPKWLRWTMWGFQFCVRCKWCGRYIRYINPNVPTFGFATSANSCMSCGRMYPVPSWMWDSPDGRSYSYYRMSFTDEEFYEEFERDYTPQPLCQHRRK